MTTVHWLGAGLSSGPGIKRLATQTLPGGATLILWNRTEARARDVLAGLTTTATTRPYSLAALKAVLSTGDVVVSMLPAPMHPEIARVCVDAGAHLVTTSYLSDAMLGLDAEARTAGVTLMNECGLDPGLDHMLAHRLVASYRASSSFDPTHRVSFRSYCGGFPKVANAFFYKFSWSPLGVLRALRAPAKALLRGTETMVPRVWDAIEPFVAGGEEFEAYPNRDSMPYVADYGFDAAWPLQTFVRGTLRLKGWSAAWKDIFAGVSALTDAELEALAQRLWHEHSYAAGEADRVVLSVALSAEDAAGKTVFNEAWLVDEAGDARRSAMGALVSIPAALAVTDLLAGQAPRGVHGAPRDEATIARWFDALAQDGITIRRDTTAS